MNWNEVKKNTADILNLAEQIASEKNIKLVICMDEFQNIAEFTNPLAFQKKLRANWQKHRHVSYCLYGSKRHMMTEVFASPSMPFYKFGDLMYLDKIKSEEWANYIVKRFNETGKKINLGDAEMISKLTDNHSYYVQQLAQQTWLRTSKSCSASIVHDAHESLVMQLNLLFQTITDNLSNKQLNLLHAILCEVEQLSSSKLLIEYQLGTSANVLKMKDALVNKEIIDIQNKKIEFSDPVYKYWLKKYYFKI